MLSAVRLEETPMPVTLVAVPSVSHLSLFSTVLVTYICLLFSFVRETRSNIFEGTIT